MNENIENPLVSVVVPSYNHAKYIAQCINSILNQTYKNFELIVIDDGSTDESSQILYELQHRFGFKLIFQENIGVARTFNKAITNYVDGEYFTFCASDDFWMENKLEKQVSFMERYPLIPMCYGKSIAVNENNIEIPKYTTVINRNLKGGDVFKEIICGEFHPPVNYLLRTNIIKNLGLYDPKVHTEDFYMNLKISSNYQIGFLNEFISYYRVIEVEKKRLDLKIYNSKIKCVENYSKYPCYKKALKKIKFNAFLEYSSYTNFKIFTIKCLFDSGWEAFQMDLFKGIIKFILIWK